MDDPIADSILRLRSSAREASLQHFRTSGNQVAHEMVSRSLHMERNFVFLNAVPRFICKVFGELIWNAFSV